MLRVQACVLYSLTNEGAAEAGVKLMYPPATKFWAAVP